MLYSRKAVKFSWGSGGCCEGRSPCGGPVGEAPVKFLGILGYFRSTNAIYKALFVRKTLIIPFLISFLTLWREVVLTL